ncbi:MAG: type II toxin-antitoxin system VapC family toxin [Anaerolineales bacterium]|nr:type II toxin-antitoxin system VapC family toxin [Anaerolineales bacterium]
MAEDISSFVLDAFALIAHFDAEPGGDKVTKLLKDAGSGGILVAMRLINVGELFYIIARQQGIVNAQAMLEDVRDFPITFYDATEARIFAAARMKAEYPISYADSFAASLALELNASLVTGDPEFKTIKEELSIFWLEK